MSTAPTSRPTEDPWQVPAPAAAAAKKAAPAAAKPGSKKLSPQQAARLRRMRASQAETAKRITWPRVVGLTVTTATCRLLFAASLVAAALDEAHLRSLLLSPATTQAQWNAAVHTARELGIPSDFLICCVLGLPTLTWTRVRLYVAKLPGVAPHPMQKSNLQARVLNLPAYWPPVPQGTPSWTRRIPWRGPAAISAATFVVMTILGNWLNHLLVHDQPTRYAWAMLAEYVAAALALTGCALDLVRLREYRRWPGRPRGRG